MTGFYRDGYCRVGPEDTGNHAIAGSSPVLFPLPSSHFLSSINPPLTPSLSLSLSTFPLQTPPPPKAPRSPPTAILTDPFLDFSASRGNNLRSIGLTSGCKWCLCTSRWQEAVDAATSAEDPVVPKVFLHATDQSALERVKMEDLKKYAAEGELGGVGGRTVGPRVVEEPEKRGGLSRETH